MAAENTDFQAYAPEPELEFGDAAPAAPELDLDGATASDPVTASLTPQELEKVSAFVQKIDITDTAGVLAYGVGSQRKVSEFSSAPSPACAAMTWARWATRSTRWW